MKNTIFKSPNKLYLKNLINKIAKLPFGKSGTKRICFHKNIKEDLHVMIVYLKHKKVFPVHFHKNSEFLFQMKGKLKLRYKVKNKKKIFSTILSKDKPFFYINKKAKHSTEALTNNCIYMEFIRGPLKKGNTKIVNKF